MAADTVGLLDALGIGRVHLVGMSMGGMIAQTVAARHPARVLSLTSVFSTTGDRRVGPPARSALLRPAEAPARTVEEAPEGRLGQLGEIGPTALPPGAEDRTAQR